MIYFILICVFAAMLALAFYKPLQGLRTKLLSSLVVIGGGVVPLLTEVTGYLKTLDWTQYIEMKVVPWVMGGLGVLYIILYNMTKRYMSK